MDTFIVALIVLAAVIAVLNSFAKTFRSGSEGACGCGCSCAGCDVEKHCPDASGNPERIV
ncbi:MAG: FeoB-associated Cys-rich membrane protein [Desulfobacterales bacterium]|nr:FeoB-associated Cys-rich membrane protein [Desulfobacterales bacterium]